MLGKDIGSSLSIYSKGHPVVNIAAGLTDSILSKAYEVDTFQMVYLSTKTMCGIVIAMLVNRGQLEYTEKVSKYWPDFA